MGDQKDQRQELHLLKLPEEIIAIITRYLDLIDLKNLSLTCHFLNEFCGKRLGKHFKISFSRILNHRDVKTFENSKRKYENVGVHELLNRKALEDVFKQVQLLPSFEIKRIYILVNQAQVRYMTRETPQIKLEEIVELLKRNVPTVQEIFTKMHIDCKINSENYNKILSNKCTISNEYKLSLELEISSPINFRQIYMDFNYPTKIILKDKINVDQMMENVKEIAIHREASGSELKWFTKLEKLKIYWGVNLGLMRALITNNKETLRYLQLNSVDITTLGDNFELPCQLKTLECVEGSRHIYMPTTFLSSQSNLRNVRLYNFKLTNDLLDTLSNQKMLSKLSLEHCSLEDSLDLEKFEFLKNVLEINSNCERLLIVKIIFDYADKVERLSLAYGTFHTGFKKVDDLDNEVDHKNGRKLLSNLKYLKMNGRKFSEFVISRIEAPNLEKCCINCNPDLLYDCQRLKILKIKAILNPMDIKNLWINLPSLEVIELTIDHTHLEETMQYVLRNINNVVYFRLYCRGRLSLDQTMEYKNMIAETLNNLEISFLESFRHNMVYSRLFCNTDKFSFEIDFEMTTVYHNDGLL